MTYLIKMGCSTRKSTDPKSPLWDQFYEYRPGDIVDKFPEWVPVKDWEDSGHVAVVTNKLKNDVSKEEDAEGGN
jgi:hypothetical protein